MSKKIDAGTAGLYSFKPKSPAPGNGLAAKGLAVSEDLQVSAQATIEDKLTKILEDFCGEHNDEWLNITLKQLQDFITTETTKARLDELKRIPIRSTYDPSDDTNVFWWHSYYPHELKDRIAALQKEHQKGDL